MLGSPTHFHESVLLSSSVQCSRLVTERVSDLRTVLKGPSRRTDSINNSFVNQASLDVIANGFCRSHALRLEWTKEGGVCLSSKCEVLTPWLRKIGFFPLPLIRSRLLWSSIILGEERRGSCTSAALLRGDTKANQHHLHKQH